MNKRECVSCGAPITHGALKCEYCGMIYDPDYWAGTLRYVPLHMGRKCLRARTMVDNFLMNKDVDRKYVADRVRYDLTHKLAEGLSEMMTIRMNYDPKLMVTIVDGEVWVEEPDRRAAIDGW